MPPGEPSRTKVLLDASNIMYHGSATDEEGNDIPDGNVLQSAFEWYEKLGWPTEAVMSKQSYKMHNWKKCPGASVLSKLVKSGKLDATSLDDDAILLYRAVEEEAYIVTHDKFDDKVRDGKTTERQRSQHPDLPWDEIDKYTRGTEKQKDGTIKSGKHWHVSGTAFYDPDMPRAPKRIFENKFNELFKATEDLESVLTKLGSLLEGHSEDDLPKKAILGKRLTHMHEQALRMKADIPEDKLDEESLDGHTVVELKSIARDLEISGRSNKKKEQLIQMIKDHINPSPEKIKEDAKKAVADLVQQAGIQATKRREESRPKPKDKYPKTSRKPRKKPTIEAEEDDEKSHSDIPPTLRHLIISAFKESEEGTLAFPDIWALVKNARENAKLTWKQFLSEFGMTNQGAMNTKTKRLLEICDIPYTLTRDSEAGMDYAHYTPSPNTAGQVVNPQPKNPKTSRKSKGEMKTVQCGEVVVNNLRKTAPQARPRKKSTLIGHIKSLRSRSWSKNVHDGHILHWLKQKGLISISDNDTKSVKYNL